MWKARCVKCTRHCTLVLRAASRTEGNKKGTALYSNKKWLKIQWPTEVCISFSNTTSYKSPPAWLHVLVILKALGLFSNLTIPSWEWAKGFSSSKEPTWAAQRESGFPFPGGWGQLWDERVLPMWQEICIRKPSVERTWQEAQCKLENQSVWVDRLAFISTNEPAFSPLSLFLLQKPFRGRWCRTLSPRVWAKQLAGTPRKTSCPVPVKMTPTSLLHSMILWRAGTTLSA